MNLDDILWLKVEVVEKLKQYDNKKRPILDYSNDDLEAFERYFNPAKSNWNLSTVENVFYLFSGYGMYWATNAKGANKDEDTLEPEEENVDTID